jgi:hypothetical protein
MVSSLKKLQKRKMGKTQNLINPERKKVNHLATMRRKKLRQQKRIVKT